jgi:hypothetical protein
VLPGLGDSQLTGFDGRVRLGDGVHLFRPSRKCFVINTANQGNEESLVRER